MRAEERPQKPWKAAQTVQLRQENIQRQAQVQKLAPHLIQANALLQCSTLELQQIIEQEQQENPALDILPDGLETGETGCRLCPGSRIGGCAHCPFSHDSHPLSENGRSDGDDGPSLAESQAVLAARGDDTAEDQQREARTEGEWSQSGGEDGGGGEGDFDPLLLARTQTTLAEELLLHLRATSQTAQEMLIAEYLVDSLDARGWLQVDIDEACAVLRVPCRLIMQGIERLQGCEPSGVGARDLHECLLLQMRALREEGDPAHFDTVALVLLTDHWKALIQRRHVSLARKLNVTPQSIETALAFIRKLHPNPAAGFRPPWDNSGSTGSKAVRPDVIIKRSGIGFVVEIVGFENTALQVNPHYRGLYEAIRASRSGGEPAKDGGVRLSADHQKHVIAYVERANMFLKNLQQRRRTIHKITQTLIECQQGFLETGQRSFLRPLTRTRLAKMVGMHESTISRALLQKYVQLPTQDVVSFDVFFENAVSIKEIIASLVAAETREAPLCDQAIVDALTERGHTVARRTVVKYREDLRIPASYLRRRR